MEPHKHSSVETDYLQEAVLDASIQFPHALSKNALNPKGVFLTGVTGLLGAYLLDELLHKTQALVYCLVRAETKELAGQRLIKHMQAYGLWQPALAHRVIAMAGDVAQPRFALSETQFQELAEQVDVIYHSAGLINMRYSYARLKPTNVLGVVEGLRLAGLVKTKPFHFVSSIAVFYSDAHPPHLTLHESDVPQFHPGLKGDYGKSKWVADRLVAAAQARGLPACIYRPTRIMGHSRTGALNDTRELLPRVVKGCIQMGAYPDWDIDVTWVPVDYVSRTMVHVASKPQAFGQAFHLFNPAPIPWRVLMDNLHNLGYALQEIPHEQWRQELRHHATHNSAVDQADKAFYAALMMAFTGLHYLFHQRPPFDAAQTLAVLADSGISCPPIDPALIAVYVAYWQKNGFLPAPA
ncbi:MAG: NAD-dependent epimerase/dehydratase family protein [Methylococcaceae bacterium]|nr:MAG: NAD-dependent epimerase/dehydratase family protein [Methylococcaceae bacterium]